MKKKLLTAVVVLVLAMAVIGVVIHKNGQDETSGIVLISESEQVEMSLDDLTTTDFSGTLVNGKGETFEHDFNGILLRDAFEKNGFVVEETSEITVTSADNYSATISGDEILNNDKVYIATVCDGEKVEGIDEGTDGAELVVFGDKNSKRCVRYLMKVEVK